MPTKLLRQIVSKGLFGILGFLQKTKEQIRFRTVRQKKIIRLFFGRIRRYSRVRNKRTPLNKHNLMNIWQKQ